MSRGRWRVRPLRQLCRCLSEQPSCARSQVCLGTAALPIFASAVCTGVVVSSSEVPLQGRWSRPRGFCVTAEGARCPCSGSGEERFLVFSLNFGIHRSQTVLNLALCKTCSSSADAIPWDYRHLSFCRLLFFLSAILIKKKFYFLLEFKLHSKSLNDTAIKCK